MRRTELFALALVVACFPVLARAQQPTITGVDFGDQPGVLFVPVHKVAGELGLSITGNSRHFAINGHEVKQFRQLFDGTKLIPLRTVKDLGGTVEWDPALAQAKITVGTHQAFVKAGVKRAVVNKQAQQLRAYQGDLLVLETRVSTGRKGHATPAGDFAASRKERLHLSSLYDDSPMPYAVQIHGNIFVHGFTSVPRYPASHGCVRMPMWGKNPARWFYSWISVGTPVIVANAWPASETDHTAMNNVSGARAIGVSAVKH